MCVPTLLTSRPSLTAADPQGEAPPRLDYVPQAAGDRHRPAVREMCEPPSRPAPRPALRAPPSPACSRAIHVLRSRSVSTPGDGKCVICDSYVRPATLVRVCDECNYGSYAGRCVICGGVGISDAYYCKECTLLEKDVRARAAAAVE